MVMVQRAQLWRRAARTASVMITTNVRSPAIGSPHANVMVKAPMRSAGPKHRSARVTARGRGLSSMPNTTLASSHGTRGGELPRPEGGHRRVLPRDQAAMIVDLAQVIGEVNGEMNQELAGLEHAATDGLGKILLERPVVHALERSHGLLGGI